MELQLLQEQLVAVVAVVAVHNMCTMRRSLHIHRKLHMDLGRSPR